MSGQYRDYGYRSTAPGSGAAGVRYHADVLAVIRRIGGVRTICDLGCGNGHLAEMLVREGYTVTGVDASESGIALAKKRCAGRSARFLCHEVAPGLEAHLGESPFDLVISIDVVEHLYRPPDLLDTAGLLLGSGGHLLIGTPYHGYLKNLAIAVSNRWDRHHAVHRDGGHIKFFSVRTLTNLVRSRGFGELRFHFSGRVPALWKNMICQARKE